MSEISHEVIVRALEPYHFLASAEFCEKIRIYISLLLNWNRAISLTTVTEPLEILKIHFGESVFAISEVPIANGRLADVGSGAGFPGMALAVANSSLSVTLIESNAKKCAFLSEVARALELHNITVIRSRMGDVPKEASQFDFITARALGQYEDLLNWALKRLSKGGKVVLWLGEPDAEQLSRNPQWKWDAIHRIPKSNRKCLFVGSLKE